MNYFCQLVNVHGIKDVRQTEMHTGESLGLSGLNCYSEVEKV